MDKLSITRREAAVCKWHKRNLKDNVMFMLTSSVRWGQRLHQGIYILDIVLKAIIQLVK